MRFLRSRLLVPISKIATLCALIPLAMPTRATGLAYQASILYPLSVPTGFIPYPAGESSSQTVGDILSRPLPPTTSNAELWTSSGAVDLNPVSLFGTSANSTAAGADATQQVGDAGSAGSYRHAMLWSGTADSAIDLNPTSLAGFDVSTAVSVSGNQQAGYGGGTVTGSPNIYHALLWSGTAASAIDLNPSNLVDSEAFATDGIQQVGCGDATQQGSSHALLWSGTPASVVDLNPANFAWSQAFGLYGLQQVGWGNPTGSTSDDALLWNGTAESAVDLNPSAISGDIDASEALATNGTQQVGWAEGRGAYSNPHAIVWTGTADSAADLQAYLPATSIWSESKALSIDASGNIYGVAYTTTSVFAVEWSSVPEPAATSMAAVAFGGFLVRRHRASS